MNIVYLLPLLIISFVIRTFRCALYHTFLFQIKEYRIDRLSAHLRTSQGKKLIFGKLTILKWILLLAILVSTYLRMGTIYRYSLLTFWILIFLEAIWALKELFFFGWRMPKFTIKVVIILGIVFVTQFGLIISGLVIHGKYLLGAILVGPLLDKLLGPSLIILMAVFNFLVLIYKKWMMRSAAVKISNFKKLKVIGITGSYGKTSTKEFLATVLSEKFKVAKTPEFTNTDIGIANYILKDLKQKHEIFVVEMGAYKKGEIKAICDIVKPKMGIITGINEQHLELFGSLENTMRTKFELIENLPKGATAIFNGNNQRCLEMANWTKKFGAKTIIFKTNEDVKNIKQFKDHIEFNFTFENKDYLMEANLLGVQVVENILAAIYAAKSLGMSIANIQKGVAKITSPAKTMQIAGSKNGSTFIDDTFNANPDGVLAAVDYMKHYKGKKVLVMTPLIELGEAADKIHSLIGEKVSQICDMILLTNINYSKSFIDGAKKSGNEEKTQIVNTSVGAKLIEDNLTKDGVVVFEGKEAGRILKTYV